MIEAMKQALEALERLKAYGNVFRFRQDEQNPYDQACEAIESLRQAIANEALNRMAENARELGLDYEPVPWIENMTIDSTNELSKPTTPVQAEKQEPFGHVTVRRLSQRFENHADQYHFYRAGQSPYLDNVDECYAVYTRPQARKPLTDEQREEIAKGWRGRNWTVGDIIDATEAAHGIKENP